MFLPNHHPLKLTINEEGICSGCLIHKEKDEIDWNKKLKDLKTLVKSYTSKNKKYDCIVPVSGAGDSYYLVHLVKNVLNLNPLLVSYNKHYNTPLGIWNLANLKIQFDCDLLMNNTNPQVIKKITRSTFRRFGSIYWHVIAGQTVFPVQTSIRFKIPLIIWGAHQGIEQVGMFSYHNEVEMNRRYRKEHDLMGFEAEDLISPNDLIQEKDIYNYIYPSDFEINSIGTRGIYLNNYFR